MILGDPNDNPIIFCQAIIMSLKFSEIVQADPKFDPYESFSFVRRVEKSSGTYGILCGKWDTNRKRDYVWLGKIIDDQNDLYYSKELGVYEFSFENGYKPRPDYSYGVYRTESYELQYGDYWVFDHLLQKTSFGLVLSQINPELTDTLRSLLLYKLSDDNHANYKGLEWYESSYAKLVYPRAAMSSGSISTFLKELGKDWNYREFFRLYLDYLSNISNTDNLLEFPILIDSTGLPNDIKMPITAISNHNGEVNNEVRVIYVTDKITGLPIFFKYISGNIIDNSTIEYIIETLKMYKIDIKSIIMDAGYNSISNLLFLCSLNIDFITRMQENRKKYKQIINDHALTMLDPDYLVPYLDKTIFCKKIEVTINDHIFYAFLCFDVDRFSFAMKTYRNNYFKDSKNFDQNKSKILSISKFVLLSNHNFDTKEILDNYYKRQQIEQNFDISKNSAALIPLRVHTEEGFRGHLIVCFIQKILLILLSKEIKSNKFDPADIFHSMSKLRIEIYNNKDKILKPLDKVNKLIVTELELKSDFDIKSGDFNGEYLKGISKNRKPVRPLGRKNKVRCLTKSEDNASNCINNDDKSIGKVLNPAIKPENNRRGRKIGSKNKPKDGSSAPLPAQTKPRPRGRPLGSKNKPKDEAKSGD
ncbi:MAG: transposase [Rickettsiales bacterium]|jgi:hypothetical protein|nr:transposase [Rickettsiales bacterium]